MDRMDDKKPRLLFVTPTFRPEVGGLETRLNDLCAYLKKHEYHVQIICYQPIVTRGRGLRHEADGTIRVRRITWFGGDVFHKLLKHPVLEVLYLVPGLLLHSWWFMLRHGRRIDTIHAFGLNSAIVGRVLKALFRKRLVVTTHAIYDFEPGSRMAKGTYRVLRGADKVVALSKASEEELVAIGLPAAKVTTHVTWVNQDVFKPSDRSEARARIGVQDRFMVLFVGRLRKNKGINLLLDLAAAMKDVSFVFVGDGEMADVVRAEADQQENVLYAGGKPTEGLPPYYNAADVFVMPSQYREGFGRVAIEALSCGIPVVYSNRGGIGEYLTEDVSLGSAGDKDGLRTAIEALRGDAKRLDAMRAQCREYAVEHFGEKNAETLVCHYEAE